MQFLKENKKLFYTVLTFPIFFFYLDRAVILWMRDFHGEKFNFYPFLESIDRLISFIAHGATLIVIAFMLYVLGKFLNQRLHNTGRSLIIAFISVGIVVQLLKHLIGRARPRLTYETTFIGPSLRSGYDSFPSGHTAVAYCLAYILSQHFPKYRFIFYSFAIFTGLERIEGISHFPSDVLAGAVLGLIIGKILSAKIFRLRASTICQE